MENRRSRKGRVFTIELQSKKGLKNITVSNGSGDGVYIEGTIGELVRARFEEGVILEVEGKKGVLRIDLEESEVRNTKNDLGERGGK